MKIVTDSSVMFSVEDGARRGMTVLPLVVAIDGQTWLEYEDISAEEFLAKVRAGALPQSASPPPALTLAAYDTDDEVIHLAMADGLSGAYEVACGLVKQARHPERVQVVNTRTLCVPHRVLACTAVQLAGQGLDAAAVLEALDAQIATAHSYLIPEDFDYLRRGGRLTPLAATFAHLVKAFPVMKQTDDGTRLEKMKVARSFAKAVNAIADDLEARGVGEGFFLSVSHADNPSQAEEASRMLAERFPGCRRGIFELGPAFITQGGPGCLAIQAIDLGAFPDLVLDELAKRLVEDPDPADLLPGQPLDALRITCAIDALADHLDIELSDADITAQMPGNDAEQREKIRQQLEDQGLGDEARVFARREAALSWLVNNSRVSYK